MPSCEAHQASTWLDERSLSLAFSTFTAAANSLEDSYRRLQGEVGRLRRELEQSNAQLASSLEENERVWRHLQSIVASLPCGVIVAGANGMVSLANPYAKRLFGLGVLREVPQPVARALTCEAQEIPAAADSKWLRVRQAKLQGEDDGTRVIIVEDVSEFRRIQLERDELRRREALAEMSSVLAHEIRNPLGSLELFAGLLADGNLSSEQREWVSHLQSGLRLLAATVNNVLHFHSRPSLQTAPVELALFLRGIAGFISPMAERAQVKVELSNEIADVCLSMDRHRMQQVFLNLALNAIRSMPHGGELVISARRSDEPASGWVDIQVRDTGCGIEPRHLEKIFEPGFSTRPGSPGLGLSVCNRIVEQHGGRMTVFSEIGVGSVFSVQLQGGGR